MSLRGSWSTHGCEYLFCRARTKRGGQSTEQRTCHFFPSALLFKVRTNSGESGSILEECEKKNLQLQDAIGFNTPTKTYVWNLIHSPGKPFWSFFKGKAWGDPRTAEDVGERSVRPPGTGSLGYAGSLQLNDKCVAGE